MMPGSASLRRIGALVTKEFRQMRRDRLTFGILIAIPIIQLILFGFAINTDPRHLPTVLNLRDNGPVVRSFIAGLENSTYFRIVGTVDSEEQAEYLLHSGEASFVITVPENFEHDLLRGLRPVIHVDADASDPSASSNGLNAIASIADTAFRRDFNGPLASAGGAPAPFDVRIHRRYNPAGVTALNIVPGLLGVILTMTMTLITAAAITREAERGTLESLLATPVRPIEVMIGKVTPYIFVGYVQAAVILLAAYYVFEVPFVGSMSLLLAGTTLFVFVNLTIGFLFSTVARSQLQAMQMSFFFLLPSILLSGFMFPFKGMPDWAQALGLALPATHFMRFVRSVLLKGAGIAEVWTDIWPLCAILVVTATVSIIRYRTTLD